MTAKVTEVDFQAQVRQLAKMLGWRCLHVRRSIGKGRKWMTTTSIIGWPDLYLFHPRQGRQLAAELKTENGIVTPEQRECLADLAAAGVPSFVWRPSDWPEIQATLESPKTPANVVSDQPRGSA